MHKYYHVDVFSKKAFSGNGCTVFTDQAHNEQITLQNLTIEMRQFESVFLGPPAGNRIKARIFTMQEELSFAGHPILAAAAVASKVYGPKDSWILELSEKNVEVVVREEEGYYSVLMDQGVVSFGSTYSSADVKTILEAISIERNQIDTGLPIQVVSTGLPYFIVPVKGGLIKMKYLRDISADLKALGAHFLYIFDTETMEGRSFDNDGLSEDIATGSAAGPTAGWLHKHGAKNTSCIKQGSFLGRPSEMGTQIYMSPQGEISVKVSAPVCFVAEGQIYSGLI